MSKNRDPEHLEPYDFAFCNECGGRNGHHIDNDDGTPCGAMN